MQVVLEISVRFKWKTTVFKKALKLKRKIFSEEKMRIQQLINKHQRNENGSYH